MICRIRSSSIPLLFLQSDALFVDMYENHLTNERPETDVSQCEIKPEGLGAMMKTRFEHLFLSEFPKSVISLSPQLI